MKTLLDVANERIAYLERELDKKVSYEAIRDLIEAQAQRCYEGSDYGSYDHNRGVNTLRKVLLNKVAKMWAKEQGATRVIFAAPNPDNEYFFAYHCLGCNEYHVLNGVTQDILYCSKCSQAHYINREWNIVYILNQAGRLEKESEDV